MRIFVRSSLRLCGLALLASALSGCGTVGRSARVNPAIAASIGNQDCLVEGLEGDDKLALDLDCFTFPRTVRSKNAPQEEKAPEKLAYTEALESQTARNRLQAILLSRADMICTQEKGHIYGRRAAVSSILDFFAAGLSTSSSIVTGERAKSILAGLAGLSVATHGNIDANVYQNQIAPAITKVMDTERNRLMQSLLAHRMDSVDTYTVDDMVRLVNEYHQACSFGKGVQLLLDAALNQEGMAAVVREMNLRQAETLLNMQIASETRRAGDPLLKDKAEASLLQLQDRLRTLQQERFQNLMQNPVSVNESVMAPATPPIDPQNRPDTEVTPSGTPEPDQESNEADHEDNAADDGATPGPETG